MTLAERLIRVCTARLPPHLREWADAMASEAASIREPASALLFALGCVGWAMRTMSVERLKRALTRDPVSVADADAPSPDRNGRGRWPAVACAIAASTLGLLYLEVAGAPLTFLTMNFAALVAGLVIVLPFSRRRFVQRPASGVQALFIGAALILTAAFGPEAAGVTRWLMVGEVVVQPSLILLPLLVISFARSRDVLAATGVILAGVAMAWQPDRAMAGALVAGVAAIALSSPDRSVRTPLAVCAAAFATTLLRPDAVPATPFVDHVFSTAFALGPVAGLAVWGGAAILLLPALLGCANDRAHRPVHFAFATVWGATVLAAIIGNYPAPLVAYGGSAIVGYLLATLALPRHWSARIPVSQPGAHPERALEADRIVGRLREPRPGGVDPFRLPRSLSDLAAPTPRAPRDMPDLAPIADLPDHSCDRHPARKRALPPAAASRAEPSRDVADARSRHWQPVQNATLGKLQQTLGCAVGQAAD